MLTQSLFCWWSYVSHCMLLFVAHEWASLRLHAIIHGRELLWRKDKHRRWRRREDRLHCVFFIVCVYRSSLVFSQRHMQLSGLQQKRVFRIIVNPVWKIVHISDSLQLKLSSILKQWNDLNKCALWWFHQTNGHFNTFQFATLLVHI